MAATLVALSSALAVAWIPVLLKFIRSWMARKNPVSLAICGVILLSIYSNIVIIAVYAYDGNPSWAAVATHLFNGLVCVNFYLSFMWARKRFPDARS